MIVASPPSNGPLPAGIVGAPVDVGEDAASLPVHDAVIRAAFALLTPEQLAEVMVNRVVIERATGMLMMVYGVDADSAFDLLRVGSQSSNVNVRLLAEQLSQDLWRFSQDEDMNMRSVCDAMLLTGGETGHRAVAAGSSSQPRQAQIPVHCVRVLTLKSVVAQWVP